MKLFQVLVCLAVVALVATPLTAETPKITKAETSQGAGMWIGTSAQPGVAIYNGYGQGPVIGIYGKNIKPGLAAALAVDKFDGEGYIQLVDDKGEAIIVTASDIKELLKLIKPTQTKTGTPTETKTPTKKSIKPVEPPCCSKEGCSILRDQARFPVLHRAIEIPVQVAARVVDRASDVIQQRPRIAHRLIWRIRHRCR